MIIWLIIGIIMLISGITVAILGTKKKVPNTLLWALFPIFHAFHEFAEYALEELAAPFWVERVEIYVAAAGSLALIAAALEYNGFVQRPLGKITALLTAFVLGYYIFLLPEEIIEDVDHAEFSIGVMQSNPFRFLYGFILVWITVLIFILNFYNQHLISKQKKLQFEKKKLQFAVLIIVLLAIHSFFEGFESQNDIFIFFRAVSLSLFIIIPILVIINTDFGLDSLLVIDQSGILLWGFDFKHRSSIDAIMTGKGFDDALLKAGFLSAVSGFAGNVLKGEETFSIRSNNEYFLLSKVNKFLFALQTKTYTQDFKNSYTKLTQKLYNIFIDQPTIEEAQIKQAENTLIESLKEFIKTDRSKLSK